jgi:MinD superfamily P-loop ATPase
MTMKQLVVISGKGGTGKTSVTASLAHLASQRYPLLLVDADVDAANLELVLNPQKAEEHAFMGMDVAQIDEERCAGHGVCETVCRFEAIRVTSIHGKKSYSVDRMACEGCGACYHQCPQGAIRMVPQQAGLWFQSETPFGTLFHAQLFAGQPNSGKLVTLVKQEARKLGLRQGRALMLVDGPPGIGCPVIATLSGADLALLVIEPTPSGLHDLERVLGTANHFGIPSMVVINKFDLNHDHATTIVSQCQSEGIDVIGQIPYDPVVTEAMVEGSPITAYQDGPVTQALQAVWEEVRERVIGETFILPLAE